MTTLPAPTVAPSPMVTSGRTTALVPMMACGSRMIVPRWVSRNSGGNGGAVETAVGEIVGSGNQTGAGSHAAEVTEQHPAAAGNGRMGGDVHAIAQHQPLMRANENEIVDDDVGAQRHVFRRQNNCHFVYFDVAADAVKTGSGSFHMKKYRTAARIGECCWRLWLPPQFQHSLC